MRKILFSLLLAVIAVGVMSCSSIEGKAKKQLKQTIEEVMKNPDTFKMKNEKVLISDDSLFVMTFNGIGENSYGGHTNQKYEYIYLKNETKDKGIEYMEYIGDANDKTSVSEMYKKYTKHEADISEMQLIEVFMKEGKTEEEAIIMQTYMTALIKCIMNGRTIEED